uniref:C-type lectin domain-containing protein n=1 Tax=Caenorhabditis tropicalis TaxID=1561998 RepID=A0A1I7TPZ5_9PELO
MISQLILVISLISFVQPDYCNGHDSLIDGQCFIVVGREHRLDFYEAQRFCQLNLTTWSNLAVPISDMQTNYITKWAQTEFGNSGNFWLGIYRQGSGKNFIPIVGPPYLTYGNCDTCNPSMNYVVARLSNGKWDTRPSETRLNFVCSYPARKNYTEALTRNVPKLTWLEDSAKRLNKPN